MNLCFASASKKGVKMRKLSTLIIILPLLIFAAQWQSLNGPPVGSAGDMSMGWDPQIPAWVIYAAETYWNKDPKRVYKSTNEGEYWDSLWQEQAPVRPMCVITDVNDGQVVYVGKKQDVTPVWKSYNGGQTWIRKSYGITSTRPLCFAMDPTNSYIVYTGFEQYTGSDLTIFKTTNSGEEWLPCGNFIHSVRDIWIDPVNPNILYIATSNSVQKTTNGGGSWVQLNPPGGFADVYCININTSVSPNVLFTAVHDCEGLIAKIYKSTDDGNNWTQILAAGYYPSSLVIDENNSNVMFATFCLNLPSADVPQTNNPGLSNNPGELYKTTDGGQTWFRSNNGIFERLDYYALTQHPGISNILFVSTSRGVYKSTDYGATWHEKTKGYKPPVVWYISAQDANVYVTSNNLISKSSDAGENWRGVHQMVNLPGNGRKRK